MSAWILDHIPSITQSSNGLFCASALSIVFLYSLVRSKSTDGLVHSPDTIAEEVKDKVKDDLSGLDGSTFEYDVVVVGGGPAGCALASRLSEDPNVRVLLVEAGGSSRKLLFSRIPIGYSRLFGTRNEYRLFTESQGHLEDRKVYWPRAKVLGGCTAMNASMFQIGAPSDFDEWAKTGLDGAEEWSYKAFRKYFFKFENYNSHPDFPVVDLKERGQSGPVNVGFFGYFSKGTKSFIEACKNLGIPENPDVNSSKGTMGVAKIMTYIDKKGTRVTGESAYLTPEVLGRPNLKVAVYSTATRVIFDTRDGKKRAIGLEFAHTNKNSIRSSYRVKVKRELIITAGAVHSPQILMLSGVGPKDELERLGIPVVHDLPGVGKNLQDHLSVHGTFSLTSGSNQFIAGYSAMDKVRTLLAVLQWKLFGSGPMTSNGGEAAAFIRSDDLKLFDQDKYIIKDETSGPNAPDIELICLPVGFNPLKFNEGRPITLPSMNITAILLRPQSRGKVTLKSANPFDPPLIDPAYLNEQNDVAVLVRGLKIILKVARTEPLSSISPDQHYPRHDYKLVGASDEVLEEEVKKRAATLFHPACTCRMAKLENDGVVDAQLKVHGLENVRIADASIFPRIMSGHTTASVYAIAEKAADIIKQALRQH